MEKVQDLNTKSHAYHHLQSLFNKNKKSHSCFQSTVSHFISYSHGPSRHLWCFILALCSPTCGGRAPFPYFHPTQEQCHMVHCIYAGSQTIPIPSPVVSVRFSPPSHQLLRMWDNLQQPITLPTHTTSGCGREPFCYRENLQSRHRQAKIEPRSLEL